MSGRRIFVAVKHTTANRILSAVRGTLKVAWRLGLMPADAYQLAASVESISGETVPAGRHLPGGELQALLATCAQDKLGIRDAALISLLYGLGLRRAEVVTLDLVDYEEAESQLIVRGKGNGWFRLPAARPKPCLTGWSFAAVIPARCLWALGIATRAAG